MQKIAATRAHEFHPAEFKKYWADLEPQISGAILIREQLLKKTKPHVLDPLELRRLKRLVYNQLNTEHRELVSLYYTLKADADATDPATRGTGERLSSAAEIDAFFDRVLDKK